jgi:hypothetical protein
MPIGSQGPGQYTWDADKNDWVLDTPALQAKKFNLQADTDRTTLDLSERKRQNERNQYEFDQWKKNLPTAQELKTIEAEKQAQKSADAARKAREAKYNQIEESQGLTPSEYAARLKREKALADKELTFREKSLEGKMNNLNDTSSSFSGNRGGGGGGGRMPAPEGFFKDMPSSSSLFSARNTMMGLNKPTAPALGVRASTQNNNPLMRRL